MIQKPKKFLFEIIFIFFLIILEKYFDEGVSSINLLFIIQSFCYSFIFTTAIQIIRYSIKKTLTK